MAADSYSELLPRDNILLANTHPRTRDTSRIQVRLRLVEKLECETAIYRRLPRQLDGHELVVYFAIILAVLDSLRVPVSVAILDGVGHLHLVHATLRIGTLADRSSHHRGP